MATIPHPIHANGTTCELNPAQKAEYDQLVITHGQAVYADHPRTAPQTVILHFPDQHMAFIDEEGGVINV